MSEQDPITRLNAALGGRYHVERELGAGGMATVYLADDLKHERKVALKVLKPELAAVVGADRFLAEIKTTANLQHPHILPLFDSGEEEGFVFYVMPYVEGESLRQRLDRESQLPVEEAVRIATDVAAALDHAHRRGVVHRDIKPANILLQDGKPMISDFGIALAVSTGGAGRLTETGLSLGTPHYMSPEQATGDLQVGPATDCYALGCVLYEMLVGEPPYTGSTPQAILGKIIAGEVPSATKQRSSVPANLDATIRKSLEKVPADRFGSAQDLVRALAEPGFRWRAEATTVVASGVPTRLSVATIVVLAALALWGWLRPPGPASTGALVSRTVVPLPEGHVLAMSRGNRYPIAISADGVRIVYVRQEGRDTRLYLRNLDELEASPIDGTEGARQPFLSPDGEQVAFFAGTELRRISVAGGIPVPITDVPPFRSGADWFGGTWSSDGRTILYSLGETLWRVPADGSERPSEVVLTMDAADGLPGTTAEVEIPRPIRWPRFLPGGETALASLGWEDQAGVTGVVDLASGRYKPLVLGGEPHYLRTGHLAVASSEERVSVVPFDLDRLEVTGGLRPVLQGVGRGPGGGATTFTVSETGTLVYVRGGFERSLFLVEPNGRADSVPVEPRGYRFPSVSADGRTLSVTVDPRPSNIWIVDLVEATATPLTTEGHNLGSAFSRDGSRLAWGTSPGAAWVRWPERDTVHRLPQLVGDRVWMGNEALVVVTPRPTSGRDLVLFNVETGDPTNLVSGPGDQILPAVSPDGRWLAFVGDQSGAEQVYVSPIDGSAQPRQITTGGGTDPRWSWDGTALFYRTESWIVSVEVTISPAFDLLGRPDSLFTGPYLFNQSSNWDVLPDGRFLMIKGDPRMAREFVVVINWFEELMEGAPN